MSNGTDKLIEIAAEVGKQVLGKALEWGIGKLREEAKAHGVSVPSDSELERVLLAQLVAIYTAMQVMRMSIESDATKLEVAERNFRESSNVEVVEEMPPATPPGICVLCRKPMPEGEEMFKFHGYSGPCPPADKP